MKRIHTYIIQFKRFCTGDKVYKRLVKATTRSDAFKINDSDLISVGIYDYDFEFYGYYEI